MLSFKTHKSTKRLLIALKREVHGIDCSHRAGVMICVHAMPDVNRLKS